MKRLGKRGESPAVVVRLPAELRRAVKAIAKSERSSVSIVVREAVEAYVAGRTKRK